MSLKDAFAACIFLVSGQLLPFIRLAWVQLDSAREVARNCEGERREYFPVRNSWKNSGSLGGPAGGGGCWTTGIGVRPRRPRRERSRSRKMQRVGATRDGMSRARAHGPTIRGEKGAEAAGYEIMKITCHGEVNGWGRTLGISGAGQARHEGEEEKGTRNAHLPDASLDTELLARRENDRPNPPVILFPRTTFFVVDPAGYFGFASISSSHSWQPSIRRVINFLWWLSLSSLSSLSSLHHFGH